MIKKIVNKKLETAAAAAITLAAATAKTAEELAKAKVASDVTAAVLAADIGYIKQDIAEIKQTIKDFASRDNMYALKEDLDFWRNILVGSMLVTVFISIILKFLTN